MTGDLRRAQEALLEHLTNAIAAEHRQERERVSRSPEERRDRLVRGLLAGERVDVSQLDYDFDAWHTCAILAGTGTGTGTGRAVASLAGSFGRGLLRVRAGDQSVWVWLAGRRRISSADSGSLLSRAAPPGVRVALGEPAQGIEGFRFSHRQAQAALRVALVRPRRLTRYADVILPAALLGDEVASRSLSERYLAPLGAHAGAGGTRRETLRVYFAKGQCVTSTAAALKVSPRTVERHVRAIEALLGPLSVHRAEIELALTLERLREAPPGARGLPVP